jgi:hypothetical protein
VRNRILRAGTLAALACWSGAASAAGAGWTEPVTVSGTRGVVDGSDGPPVAAAVGEGGVQAVVWQETAGRPGAESTPVAMRARVARPGHPFGTSRRISGAERELSAPRVAVSPAGDVAVVWSRDVLREQFDERRRARSSIELAVRPAGRGWWRTTLARARVRDPQVAFVRGGRLVVL